MLGLLVLATMVMTVFTATHLLLQYEPFTSLFEIMETPFIFRVEILLLSLLYFILGMVGEKYVFPAVARQWKRFSNYLRYKSAASQQEEGYVGVKGKLYKQVQQEFIL